MSTSNLKTLINVGVDVTVDYDYFSGTKLLVCKTELTTIKLKNVICY
jgi:hypothetical protein